LQDAWFNCHRTRHDAIDAAISQISITIDSAVKNLRYSAVLAAFPDFVRLIASIQQIREQIRKSRASQDDRDALYEVVEGSDFPQLMTWFAHFQTSESVMIELARDSRRERIIVRWALIIAICAVVLGVVPTAYEIAMDRPQSAPISTSVSRPAIPPITPQDGTSHLLK